MKNIKSFFLSPFYWAKALRMIERGNDLEAFTLLNNMHVKYQDYKYYLLKSFLSLMLKEYEYSLSLMDKSLFIVSNNIKLNNDEKKYLIKYIYSLMSTAYRMIDKFDEAKEIDNKTKNLTFFINNVSKRIIQLFPQPNN